MMLGNEGGEIFKDVMLFILGDAFAEEDGLQASDYTDLYVLIQAMIEASDTEDNPLTYIRVMSNNLSKSVALSIWRDFFTFRDGEAVLNPEMLGCIRDSFLPYGVVS